MWTHSPNPDALIFHFPQVPHFGPETGSLAPTLWGLSVAAGGGGRGIWRGEGSWVRDILTNPSPTLALYAGFLAAAPGSWAPISRLPGQSSKMSHIRGQGESTPPSVPMPGHCLSCFHVAACAEPVHLEVMGALLPPASHPLSLVPTATDECPCRDQRPEVPNEKCP